MTWILKAALFTAGVLQNEFLPGGEQQTAIEHQQRTRLACVLADGAHGHALTGDVPGVQFDPDEPQRSLTAYRQLSVAPAAVQGFDRDQAARGHERVERYFAIRAR